MKKTLFTSLSVAAICLASSMAMAAPVCDNVNSASRLVGCFGIADFVVEKASNRSEHEGGTDFFDRNRWSPETRTRQNPGKDPRNGGDNV